MRRATFLVVLPLLSPAVAAVLGGTAAGAASCGSVGMYSAGERVAAVQSAVGVAADGDFASSTLTAVQNAERARGLSVTTTVDQPRFVALGGQGDFCAMDTWSSPVVASTSDSAQKRVDAMLAFARAQAGKRYLWGGTGPDRFDCSGMVMQMLHAVGTNLGRVATQQYDAGAKVPVGQARPGDLLFFGNGASPTSIYHVTVFLGGGQMAEAANPTSGLRVSAVRTYDLLPQAVRPVDGPIWQPAGLTAPLGSPPAPTPPAPVPVPEPVRPVVPETAATTAPVRGHGPTTGRSVAAAARPVGTAAAAPGNPPVPGGSAVTAAPMGGRAVTGSAAPSVLAGRAPATVPVLVPATVPAVAPTAVPSPAPTSAPAAGSVSRYLRQGMTGTDVATVQARLGIQADGVFGPQTAAAVTAFQSGHGLQADGVVGPLTTRALGLVWAG